MSGELTLSRSLRARHVAMISIGGIIGAGLFVGGWLYWYFWMIVVAVEALAGAIILHDQWLALPVWLIGLVLLACLTVVNLFSARSYGEFEFWFSSIKVS